MNNTNNFSEFSSGAIEPRNHDLSNVNRQEAASVDSYPATITKTDLENFMTHTDAITKDAENISQDSRAISDYLDSFSCLMVHPDGSLADLSDRDGRKDLNDNIKKNTEAVETMSAKIAEAPQKMLETIPESVKAEFCIADRERFDLFFKRMGSFVDWAIPCSVVVGIVIGGFAILAAMGYSKACDYREKMEIQVKEQQEAIDFGNYMKEKNPKTLERWRRKHSE